VENFQFQSTRQYTKSNETEFYTLLLSNGTDVKTSKIARATNGYISFSETFSFEVTPNFKILVQLYGIWMKEPPKLSTLGKYLQCKVTYKVGNFRLQFIYFFQNFRIPPVVFFPNSSTKIPTLATSKSPPC
jgi:hypothetical protein